MKKWIGLLLCLVIIFTFTGCSEEKSSSKGSGNQSAGVNEVLEEGANEAENNTEEAPASDNETGDQTDSNQDSDLPEVDEDKIDVDLTTLSATMVYSEVNNMMTSPENYRGKIVKMNGLFATYHDEATDKYYFACIVRDATACCSQGIEFVLAGDHVYPDDYPKEGDEVCVIGVFDTYTEGSSTYCTLKNAKLL